MKRYSKQLQLAAIMHNTNTIPTACLLLHLSVDASCVASQHASHNPYVRAAPCPLPSRPPILDNLDCIPLKWSYGEAMPRDRRALLLHPTVTLRCPSRPFSCVGASILSRKVSPITSLAYAPTASPLTGSTVRRRARRPVHPRVAPPSTHPAHAPPPATQAGLTAAPLGVSTYLMIVATNKVRATTKLASHGARATSETPARSYGG